MRAIGRGTWFIETPGYADLHLSGKTTDLIKHVRNALARWLLFGLKGALGLALVTTLVYGILRVLLEGR